MVAMETRALQDQMPPLNTLHRPQSQPPNLGRKPWGRQDQSHGNNNNNNNNSNNNNNHNRRAHLRQQHQSHGNPLLLQGPTTRPLQQPPHQHQPPSPGNPLQPPNLGSFRTQSLMSLHLLRTSLLRPSPLPLPLPPLQPLQLEAVPTFICT